MNKHTAGPWSVSKPQIHNGGLSVDIDSPDAGHWALATVVWQMEDDKIDGKPSLECEANARLISAAPELLEALEYALSMWGDYLPAGNSNAMKAIKQARAAIAKATEITQ